MIAEDKGQAAPKTPTRWRIAGALASNAIPVIGVLFWGWSAGILMLLYWFENVVIGVFNAARMVASGVASGPAGIGACLFVVPFFAVHYGMFCLVHGMFVWTMFGSSLQAVESSRDLSDLPGFTFTMLQAEPGLRPGAVSIVIWQVVMFGVFLFRRDYRETDPMTQMFEPYGRIIVLHVTILAGGFIVLALGQPWIGVLILALIKAGFDLFGNPMTINNAQRAQQKAAWALARGQVDAALKKRLSKQTPPE
jgi:hypothetical protein